MRATGIQTAIFASLVLLPTGAIAQSSPPALTVTVTSAADGPIQPDAALTLREAIEIVNGTLPLDDLSEAERQLVTAREAISHIRFSLPAEQTTIELQAILPALSQPGTILDGTTQPGYGEEEDDVTIAIPLITLTPAPQTEIFRGLSLTVDNITVRGLSLYGFTAQHGRTASTPPADIFIAHPSPPPSDRQSPATEFAFTEDSIPPQGIVIEQNWLGLPPDGSIPEQPSAFGVSVFNSRGATLRQNRIAYHSGSGIITGFRAENLRIVGNSLVDNGRAGIPDAIRLDGRIDSGLIAENWISGNDGSAIYLFKPTGAITIRENEIRSNGQRLQRAAIYLMGSNHQVLDNDISDQPGPGVVVTAFGQGSQTQSIGNVILNNRFQQLAGLSIDLNTRRFRDVQGFQRGDGPNPVRNSSNRREDTGNGAVNAPRFISPEFFLMDGTVVLQGVADPSTEIQLYRTAGQTGEYGPLSEPLATVVADLTGRFEFETADLQPGERVSAIATDPTYGTSEPALNTVILELSEIGDTTLPATEAFALGLKAGTQVYLGEVVSSYLRPPAPQFGGGSEWRGSNLKVPQNWGI